MKFFSPFFFAAYKMPLHMVVSMCRMYLDDHHHHHPIRILDRIHMTRNFMLFAKNYANILLYMNYGCFSLSEQIITTTKFGKYCLN